MTGARKLRFLHFIPNLLSGGAQQQLAYLAEEQVRRGHDVNIAHVHSGPMQARVEGTGARLHRLRTVVNVDPRLVTQSLQLMKDVRPDVVQTWLLQMDVAAGLACRLSGRPWVLSERASDVYWNGVLGPKSWVRSRLARRADAIVSNSAAGDAYWGERVGAPVLRRVVPNAVPIDRIASTMARSGMRDGLPEDCKVVVYAGRLSPEKNLETLIPALKELASRLPVRAYLCGDGTHEVEVRSLVLRSGAEKNIRLVGYTDDVWGWMKGADAFVFVSRAEGHPNTVLEAAACGCPLVLSDIPAHRDMWSEKEALFVDGTSAKAIADGLEAVLGRSDEARARADAARGKVAHFSIERMAKEYETVYLDVLERRRERAA